jgi:hypothetical protein
MGTFSSITYKTDHSRTKHASFFKKRKCCSECHDQTTISDYSVVEVCEEDPDNEGDQKINVSVIGSVLYSYFDRLSFAPKNNFSFDRIKCDLFPKRYLSLSILRI